MDWVVGVLSMLWERLWGVLRYPIDPGSRLYYPVVLSSLAFALVLYLRSGEFVDDRRAHKGFLRSVWSYVFPREVWTHPSTQVDLWYFVPHQMVRSVIYTTLSTFTTLIGSRAVLGGLHAVSGQAEPTTPVPETLSIVVLAAVVAYVLGDLIGYLMHYAQHVVPALWEFHKVHHSSQSLNPFSNYREHPVDNALYAIGIPIVNGAVLGTFEFLYGVRPHPWMLPFLGLGVLTFAFDVMGYHLRHSHLWLRWPGVLGVMFGSPAHHQIHHSAAPEHINKNFAFAFPVWDAMFGTLCLPEKKIPIVFGLGDGTEGEYNSFGACYVLPFLKLAGVATAPPVAAPEAPPADAVPAQKESA